jgi:hypothetical protein
MSGSVFAFPRLRVVFPLIIVGFLSSFVIAPAQPSLSSTDSYPPDLTYDIPWSAGTSSLADVQQAFNNARSTENSQLGTSIPSLTLPDQATWDAMSDNEKAEWLIYYERVDRGLQPLHGFESNVTGIAQYYAEYLLNNNQFSHDADGNDPWERLNTNSTINSCHDFLGVAENLMYFGTSGSSIGLPLERAIYTWIYDDSSSSWGHRHMALWYPYNDNSGPAGKEGFMGIGRDSGGPYRGWNFAEVIVMNVFDPCASWVYPTPPPVPTLISPTNGTTTSDTTPYFSWGTSTGATLYQIQVDDSSSFTSPVIDYTTGNTNYTPTSGLANSTYYWHVRAHSDSGMWSDWTSTWSFTVSTGPVCYTPGTPLLYSPGNGSTTTDNTPFFDWSGTSYSSRYQIMADNNSNFSSPEINIFTTNSDYTPSSGMSDYPYYWAVRGHNNSGGCDVYGAWSSVWLVTIDTSPPESYYTYLPVVIKEESSQRVLTGRITEQGTPVYGTEVWLRYHDGSSWSTYATTTTNANGEYQFDTLPPLSGDQRYYVRWPNSYGIVYWLSSWICWEISATTVDPSYFRCDFDIDGIDLLTPASASTVAIPRVFTWSQRAITSESYQWHVADPSDNAPWAWTDRLGYVGGINLTGLSGGFTTNTWYGWWIRVYGSNGFGTSFYYNWVSFTNLGSAPESGLIPYSSLASEGDIELIAPPQPMP